MSAQLVRGATDHCLDIYVISDQIVSTQNLWLVHCYEKVQNNEFT